MREVRFILPYHSKGAAPDPGHRYVEDQLLALYSGFTVQQVVGSWWHEGQRYDDTSLQYTVAIGKRGFTHDDWQRAETQLFDIAIRGAELNLQKALYTVDHDGEVEIIDM